MSTRMIVGFSLFQTLAVGLLLLILPRIGRRGLLFGVYVGEEVSGGEEARGIRRAWYGGMFGVLVLSLLLGIGVETGVPWVPAGSASTLILVAGFYLLYLRAYRQARRLAAVAPPPVSAAPFDVGPQPTPLLPLIGLLTGLAGGLVAVGYAWSHYTLLPATVPIHFDFSGTPDGWAARSFAAVMLLPVMTLFMGAGIGALAFFVAHAKRAIRHPDDGSSARAQARFHAAMSRYLATIGILLTGMLAFGSISSIDVALGRATRLHPGFGVLAALLVTYVIGGIIYIGLRHGQGGARLERAVSAAPLTDGLADNRRWWLGMFYFNREDPAILVEHRFGLGYTLNLGNWKAVAFLVILLLGSLGFALLAAWSARG